VKVVEEKARIEKGKYHMDLIAI